MKDIILDLLTATLFVLGAYLIGLWREDPYSQGYLVTIGVGLFVFMVARRKYKDTADT